MVVIYRGQAEGASLSYTNESLFQSIGYLRYMKVEVTRDGVVDDY